MLLRDVSKKAAPSKLIKDLEEKRGCVMGGS